MYLCNTKNKQAMTTMINKLREIQNEEIANGFLNGSLWNDLEDLIYQIQNPQVETIQGELYAGKTLKQLGL